LGPNHGRLGFDVAPQFAHDVAPVGLADPQFLQYFCSFIVTTVGSVVVF